MMKKAQTATEYLIILAVVIIIALIVVGVMGGIPGIGSSAGSRASAAYWETADIAIPQYAAFKIAEDFNVTIKNNLRNSVTITAFTVGGNTQTCASTSLAPGQSTTCSNTTWSGCSAAGDSFSHSVSVTYTDDETGGSYTFSGDGNKLEGKCAN
ncbi:class III signal peptide-containing protein [Candidatus Woesearchaeota archaeon]|nr:class III signal peptide-containing protein [Candidatus Woesearchaeota archaeon]